MNADREVTSSTHAVIKRLKDREFTPTEKALCMLCVFCAVAILVAPFAYYFSFMLSFLLMFGTLVIAIAIVILGDQFQLMMHSILAKWAANWPVVCHMFAMVCTLVTITCWGVLCALNEPITDSEGNLVEFNSEHAKNHVLSIGVYIALVCAFYWSTAAKCALFEKDPDLPSDQQMDWKIATRIMDIVAVLSAKIFIACFYCLSSDPQQFISAPIGIMLAATLHFRLLDLIDSIRAFLFPYLFAIKTISYCLAIASFFALNFLQVARHFSDRFSELYAEDYLSYPVLRCSIVADLFAIHLYMHLSAVYTQLEKKRNAESVYSNESAWKEVCDCVSGKKGQEDKKFLIQ